MQQGRQLGAGFLRIFIGIDDARHQRMAYHVGAGELAEGDAAHIAQHVHGIDQAGFLVLLQVDLGHVARHYGLAAKADTGQEHFHLLDGGVLRLVQDDEGVVQRAAAHIRQRGDLDHLLLEHLLRAVEAEQVVQRVVQRAQIRVDFLRQVARQEAQALARFHRGAGQDDALDRVALQGVDRAGHCQIGFAGTGWADTEADVVVEDIAQVADLVRRAAAQVVAARLQYRAGDVRFVEGRLLAGRGEIVRRFTGALLDQGELDFLNRHYLVGDFIEALQDGDGAFGIGAADVTIFRRGEKFIVSGTNAERAVAILERFWEVADKVVPVEEVQLALVEQRASAAPDDFAPSGEEPPFHEPDITSPVLKTRRNDLRGRTPHQIRYLRNILDHDISFGIGPAGTGKTYLAVACAVDALERDAVKRIILTRPAVEAGERLGFLPGDLAQKVDPYLRPLYDALYDLLGFDRTQKMFEKQVIEIAPLAYMRGRTLNHAFVILDEAQNTTVEQMKMFLTRIGFGSKAVVTGDVTQIDLQKHQKSGLVDAMHVLRNVRGIAFSQFSSADVVRHPLVARIVDAYESSQEASAEIAPLLQTVKPAVKAVRNVRKK